MTRGSRSFQGNALMLTIARPWSSPNARPAIAAVLMLLATSIAAGQTAPDGFSPVAPPADDPPAEFAVHSSAEMSSVLSRLEALEQQAAKAAAEKKPADDWVDVPDRLYSEPIGEESCKRLLRLVLNAHNSSRSRAPKQRDT